jgi:hypothetical protein
VGVDVDALAVQLLMAHAMAAKILKVPELVIQEPEAKSLARALKQIAAQYQVNVSPRAMAFYQLLTAASLVYGPRLFMVAGRKAQQAKAQQQARQAMPVITPQGNGVPGAFDEAPPPAGSMKYN